MPVIYGRGFSTTLPGGPLISPIHEKLDDSPFVIADITYLDLNVVYEIGFAISRNKPALLVAGASLLCG